MSLVYLIYSSSYRICEEEIKKIVLDNKYVKIDNNEVSLEDIIEECNYQSLFDEKKYLIVKNSTIFSSKKKDDEDVESNGNDDELLLKYLDNPNPNNILIFVSPTKPTGTKKVVKKIKDKYSYIEIADLKIKELVPKVEAYLKDNKFKYEKDVIEYIINSCNNNYDLIINELDKIMLYYVKPTTILLKDVKELIVRPIEDKTYKLFDAILNKDLKTAMSVYEDLIIQKFAPVMLLIMLSKEHRNILISQKLREKYSKEELALKLGLAKTVEFKVNNYINYSYSYKEKELNDILLLLADTNNKMTSGKVNHKVAMEILILKLCN